jgi:hypothetical protein
MQAIQKLEKLLGFRMAMAAILFNLFKNQT